MKINGEFVVTEVADDKVAVPVGGAAKNFKGIVRLNDTAAFIWKGIADGLSREQIADKMLKEYSGVDLTSALESIDNFSAGLAAEGILTIQR